MDVRYDQRLENLVLQNMGPLLRDLAKLIKKKCERGLRKQDKCHLVCELPPRFSLLLSNLISIEDKNKRGRKKGGGCRKRKEWVSLHLYSRPKKEVQMSFGWSPHPKNASRRKAVSNNWESPPFPPSTQSQSKILPPLFKVPTTKSPKCPQGWGRGTPKSENGQKMGRRCLQPKLNGWSRYGMTGVCPSLC